MDPVRRTSRLAAPERPSRRRLAAVFPAAWQPALLPAVLACALQPAGCRDAAGSGEPGRQPGSEPDAVVAFAGPTMGTAYSVKYVGRPDSKDAARAAVEDVLAQLDLLFSTWRDDSVIARFNARRDTEPFEADAELVDVVARALRIAEASGGAYDPTVLPLVRLWGFAPGGGERGVAPSDDAIEAARARVGWRKVEVLDARHLRKRDPAVELDLSSIAKGHGSDRVSAELTRLGHRDHMVEIGGEVVCRGTKPVARDAATGVGPGDAGDADAGDADVGGVGEQQRVAWRIGIEKPAGDGSVAVHEAVELTDAALATSGDYRNAYETDGTTVHHVLDPRTGRNARTSVISVSVSAPTCALADGLATALMVVGPDGAERLLEQFGDADLRVLFLLRDGAGGVREQGIRWR